MGKMQPKPRKELEPGPTKWSGLPSSLNSVCPVHFSFFLCKPGFFASQMGTWLLHSSPCFQCSQIGNHLANQPLSQIFSLPPFPLFLPPPSLSSFQEAGLWLADFVQGPTPGAINNPLWKETEGLSKHMDAGNTPLRVRVVPERSGCGWSGYYELGDTSRYAPNK